MMILRGVATGVLTAGANGAFGLSATDPDRPDLAPSRPAYVHITGEMLDTPKPPAFLSVVANGGRLQVTVHAEAPVDGYQIGISETSNAAPTVWWSTTSGSIDQEQTGGPWFLWARSTYRGAFSLWSIYGQVRPGDDEWRLTWADESLNGPGEAAYPYTSCEFGAPAIYVGPDKAKIQIYYYWTSNAPSLNVLPTVGGAHGTRVDTILQWGGYPNEDIGVAIGYDPVAMAADHGTATYYALALNRGDNVWTLRLYACVGTAKTMVAESGDIKSHIVQTMPGGAYTYTIALSMFARDNVFTVQKADGTVLFTATDTTYPWTAARTGVALWQYTETRYFNTYYYDYLRVYARDHTGEPETVTPGAAPHNDLGDRDAAGCHPASAVTVTPSGGIAATDVQAALVELDTEKAATSHTHAEGDVLLSGPDVIVGRATAGAGGAEEIACTAAGRALLDDADAAAQRTTLGIASGTVWTSDNDGPGSTLDSDSVDGIQGAAIAQKITSATTITVGASGKDYTTIQGALDSLEGKALAAAVTINVDAGSYDPFVVSGQPYGRLILIIGDTRTAANSAYIATGNITKSGDDCTITLTTTPPSDFGSGDYITVGTCTSAANAGRFPVVSIDTGAKTVTYTNAAGVAEAVLAGTRAVFNANRIITRATDGADINLACDIGAVSGFTLLGTTGSFGTYFSTPVAATISKMHAYGIGYGFYGFSGGSITYNVCSAVKCTYGMRKNSGCNNMVYTYTACTCTYGMYIVGQSNAMNTTGIVAVTGCTNGFYASIGSAISVLATHVVANNTTDYSPTPGSSGGNYGSYIKTS